MSNEAKLARKLGYAEGVLEALMLEIGEGSDEVWIRDKILALLMALASPDEPRHIEAEKNCGHIF
jgi:hypothetical protein